MSIFLGIMIVAAMAGAPILLDYYKKKPRMFIKTGYIATSILLYPMLIILGFWSIYNIADFFSSIPTGEFVEVVSKPFVAIGAITSIVLIYNWSKRLKDKLNSDY